MLERIWRMRSQRDKKGKKGFTLIELIVVIAIIAILMALLVPKLSEYMRNAQETTKLANARAVYTAAATLAAAKLAKGENPAGTYGNDDLKQYFDNRGNVTVWASIDSDGVVTGAKYGDTAYPPPSPSPTT